MSFLEDLKRSRQSYLSAYMQFTVCPFESPDEVHAFFEGHDDLNFYYNFLMRYARKQDLLHSYQCGSKSDVYKVQQKIKESNISKRRTLFFVDKDYSDLLNEITFVDTNIFVTEYYSIESYLVTEEMLHRIAQEIFHFSGESWDFSHIIDKFKVERTYFYEHMQPITAWIIYALRHSLRPNINNIKFTKLFQFSENLDLLMTDECKSLGVFTLLEQMCGIKVPADVQPEIEGIVEELASLDPKSYIRGKLELVFFVKFLDKLCLVLNNSTVTANGRFFRHTIISEGNAIEILGPRVNMPASLEAFLERNLSTKLPQQNAQN